MLNQNQYQYKVYTAERIEAKKKERDETEILNEYQYKVYTAERIEAKKKERDETVILVHTLNSMEIRNGVSIDCGELLTVRFSRDWASVIGVSRLFLDDSLTSTVAIGDDIYILGGIPVKQKRIRKLTSIFKTSGLILHQKASSCNLKQFGWKPIPPYKSTCCKPTCVAFKGKLYIFGGKLKNVVDGTFTTSPGQVFDPQSGLDWDLLPIPPAEEPQLLDSVSSPPLADLDNNRILVHFKHESSLYAYYPDQLKWVRLCPGSFPCWVKLAALFDGIVLFHVPPYFLAYDLASLKRLDTTVSPDFPSNLLYSEFDGLISLNLPGTFCLATYAVDYTVPDITVLTFVKFRVERTPQGGLLVSFIATHRSEIFFRCAVTNYVPLAPLPGKVTESGSDG